MCISNKRSKYFKSKKIVEAAFVFQHSRFYKDECKKIYKEISFYKVYPGDKLKNILKRMIKISNFFHIRITTVYNGIQIIVCPNMKVDELIQIWKTDMEKKKKKGSFKAVKRKLLKEI